MTDFQVQHLETLSVADLAAVNGGSGPPSWWWILLFAVSESQSFVDGVRDGYRGS